ncbi:MAG: hypothetical protein UV38_C0003G0181 [candidate division TM6 bacterium GW2011_GWE2_42_60]|nr:MAG: hypothetical protein UV38_C0003G0181 [candidate division TM6 bacterium GW2011_GWE2_42_60]HBY05344.1 hypothetical protein [Candidatus Dependentiae bacterium]
MHYIIRTLIISISLSSFFLNATNSTTLPLHAAIEKNDIETFTTLLKNPEIDINQRNSSGNSALYSAVQNNNTIAVELLLEAGVEVDLVNAELSTPLQRAALVGNYEIVELLLRYNADPNKTNKIGNTALHCAAKLCKFLNFPDPKALEKYDENSKWESLEDIIKCNVTKEIIEIFTKNAQEKLKIVQLLLEYDANKVIKNEVPCQPTGYLLANKGTKTLDGQTAADIAMTQEIKDFLNSTTPEKKRCYKKVFFVTKQDCKEKPLEPKKELTEELHPGSRILYFTVGACIGTLAGITLSVCCWHLYKRIIAPRFLIKHLTQKKLSFIAERPLIEALQKVL